MFCEEAQQLIVVFSTEKAPEDHASLKIDCCSSIKQKINEKARQKLLFFTHSFAHLTAKDPDDPREPALCTHSATHPMAAS